MTVHHNTGFIGCALRTKFFSLPLIDEVKYWFASIACKPYDNIAINITRFLKINLEKNNFFKFMTLTEYSFLYSSNHLQLSLQRSGCFDGLKNANQIPWGYTDCIQGLYKLADG